MRVRSVTFLCIILVAVSMLALVSCADTTKPQEVRSGEDDKPNDVVAFPQNKFIDDREVRFAVRTVTYPKALPALTAKTEGFTDGEITGWFVSGGGKAEHISEVCGSPYFGQVSVCPEPGAEAAATARIWSITGEETGTLSLMADGGLTFANPNEYRSYGILPKGNLRKDVKIIYARDLIEEKEAVAGADRYIESHGGIPEGARRKVTPGQSNIRIVKDGALIDPIDKTLWYTVTYDHRFRGILVEPDKIEVVVDALGVARFARAWHTVRANGKPAAIISPEKAVDAAAARYGYKVWSRKGLVVSQVRLIYRDTAVSTPGDSAREFRPVWFIRITGQEVLVDAHTGEVIGQPWDSAEQRELAAAMRKFEKGPLSDKIPVPTGITFIDGGHEAWCIRPTDAEFGPLFLEAQKVLSTMRPYHKKQADQHGASSEAPHTTANGGLRLDYDGRARFTTNSKVGRDIDENDLPEDERERRLYYSKDGYYRIYAQNIFIRFSRSALSPREKPDSRLQWPDASAGGSRTKILAATTGPKYLFTYAMASDERLIELTHERSGAYMESLSRSVP